MSNVKTKAKRKTRVKLLPFDAARYLTDDAAVAEYMTAVLETDDPDLLLLVLGDVTRARGIAQIAKDAGLGRESLYKALTPGTKPGFDTIVKVARALGVRLSARAAQRASCARFGTGTISAVCALSVRRDRRKCGADARRLRRAGRGGRRNTQPGSGPRDTSRVL